MFWITENHFLFVGLFNWGNAETQTFSVSRNQDGFALAESWTRKSGTIAPLVIIINCECLSQSALRCCKRCYSGKNSIPIPGFIMYRMKALIRPLHMHCCDILCSDN